MPQRQHEPDVEEQCRMAVDRLLGRYEWRLVLRAHFIQQTYQYVLQGVAADAQRAAMYTYCEVLYRACSGGEGADRQEQGYRELFCFLYDVAQQRYAEISDEATQRALVNIYTSFAHCRQPGAFLAFALQYLHDAAKFFWRQAAGQPDSLDEPDQTGTSTVGERVMDLRQTDPADQVLRMELRERLKHCITVFLQRHPRAGEQFAAVWLKYIDGLDDLTISRSLGKPVKSVHEMRSRALKTLQRQPEWRALAIDLDIVGSET